MATDWLIWLLFVGIISEPTMAETAAVETMKHVPLQHRIMILIEL